jgi:ethanolamine utilization microcompartment shell protein EutL
MTMLQTRELFDSLASRADHLDPQVLATTSDALSACEQAVTACATGMLAEKDSDELRVAINRDLDCADVVAATRRVLTRGTDADHALLTLQLEACALACERSYELCSQFARHHEHCRISSQATERATVACREVLQSLRS